MESGWERDIEFHEGWDFCLCCGSGGDCGESIVYKRVGVVGVLCIGVVERDCTGVIDILVLDGVFMVEMVERVELVVGCVVRSVVRLVLWCVNGREYFLGHLNRKLVEMNRLSVSGFLFGMVIWANCFLLLEHGFLGKMVGADVLMDVVVEVVMVELMNMVQSGFFSLFTTWFLRDMVGVRVRIEVVVGVVVLVGAVVALLWWRWSVM